MNIPEYWARVSVDEQGREAEPGHRAAFTAFGWSHESTAAAHKMALERAKNIAKWYATHTQTDWTNADPATIAANLPLGSNSYGYGGDRPPREQIIERNDEAGWILTRNSYGSVVLNAAHVMFVDVDFEDGLGRSPQLQNNAGCLGALFGAGRTNAAMPEQAGMRPAESAAAAVRRIAEVVQSLDGMGVRLYQTAAGLRAVVTTEPYDPTSDLAQDTMQAFGVDPQYANLCRVQESFRARLTPKPWRISRTLGSPPARYPFRDAEEARQYDKWLDRYNLARVGYGVCQLIETIGSPASDEQVRPVLELHDQYTLTAGDPLA